MLKIGNQEVPVKEFFITVYDKNRKLIRQRQSMHKDANFYIVYMKSYNTFLVLDEAMLNPSSKIFKLKI